MQVTKCTTCAIEAEWRDRYLIAEKRFDKAIRQAELITLLAVAAALICFIVTVFFSMKVIDFINSFEYVEEIAYSIEQDDEGTNTAIIGSENEVVINGTDNS